MEAGVRRLSREDSVATEAPIFAVHLRWRRFRDSPLLAVRADGLTEARMEHYGRRAGLHRIAIDGRAAMIGMNEQRDALLCELELAGYVVEESFA